MKLSTSRELLAGYVSRLSENFIPDGRAIEAPISLSLGRSLDRLEYCFSHIKRKYYFEKQQVTFNHLNGDHMASLLWFLSSELLVRGYGEQAEKLGYLNKILHGLDLFPHVEMPSIFLLVHPVGTVLGRAEYQDFLVVYQGVTVGSTSDKYPSLGRGTVLFSGAKVIDGVKSGDDVVYGANALIIDVSIPDSSIVVGSFPAHRVLASKVAVRERFFNTST